MTPEWYEEQNRRGAELPTDLMRGSGWNTPALIAGRDLLEACLRDEQRKRQPHGPPTEAQQEAYAHFHRGVNFKTEDSDWPKERCRCGADFCPKNPATPSPTTVTAE